MKRNFVLLLAVLVAAVFAARTTNAAVPMLLTHQGRLLDASDQPVTGTRDLTFRIYEVPAGGAPLWTETHLAVPVSNGLFNVILGSSITISGDLIVTGGTLETERYLAIQVGGDVDELSPRRRMTAAAYSVASSRVSGDIETAPGIMVVRNTGASVTGTINASATEYTATGRFSDAQTESITEMRAEPKNIGLYLRNTDLTGVNGDQTSDLTTDSAGSELKLVSGPLTGMSGSTTATIRTGATGGGGGGGGGALQQAYTAIGRFSDGTIDNVVEQVSDATGASSRLSGMSGSTTGTIRLSAQPAAMTTVSVSSSDASAGRSATLNVSASPGGSASAMSHDADNDGTPEHLIDQDCDEISSRTKLTGMSGSTTGTIRMAATADSVGNYLDHDSDGDGIPEDEISMTVTPTTSGVAIKTKGTGADPNRVIGSTCDDSSAVISMEIDDDGDGNAEARKLGTLVMKPGVISASGRLSVDTDDDGVAESWGDDDCDGISARSVLGGRSGSTTGTIRMMASPDSADHEVSVDDTLTGVSSKVKEKAARAKCQTNLQHIRTTGSSGIEETCDSTGASSRLSGMSGSTTGTIRMAAAPESSFTVIEHDDDGDGIPEASAKGHTRKNGAIIACNYRSATSTGTTSTTATPDSAVNEISHDADNDGIAQARGIIVTKGSGGGSTGSVSQKFTFDTDDNGVSDNDVDLISNGAGAASRLIGRGGSTTGTIRMTATADSSVFDLGISGSTTGTIRIQTSSTGTANPIEHSSGAHLTVGGAWTNGSDKNLKENFSEVNGEELLEKIEDLSIKQWNYKSEDESITHIGPTAQDFKDAFGVGGNDKSISTIDPSGIALAAIKELIRQNQELMKANEELSKRVKALEKKQQKP